MTIRQVRGWGLLEALIISGVMTACSRETRREPAADSVEAHHSAAVPAAVVGEQAPPTTADSVIDNVSAPDAERTLRRFLEIQVETHPRDAAAYDTLQMCPPDEEAEATLWLASFKVLSSSLAADAVITSAEVVSVAEQRDVGDARHSSVVTRRLAVDTLHWVVKHDRRTDMWRVCGRSQEGWDFIGYGRSDNVSYQPPGVTRSSLLRLVDSVRQANHARR